MKLTNKQKLSIRKSLKLNEDFFDDFNDNSLIDEPDDVLIDEPEYTYHINFIIYMYPFIKNNYGWYCVYYFEDPKYKPIIESGFISMKKALECILQATSIVSDYSKPKFCSSSEKIIEAFPFMNNTQSNEFGIMISDNQFITLKTSINLSRRKNLHNILKMFYSFWRLQKIYYNLITEKISMGYPSSPPYINIGVYKNNPHNKSVLYELVPFGRHLTSTGLELIKFLNSKDETDE